jgi:hypothetical protein
LLKAKEHLELEEERKKQDELLAVMKQLAYSKDQLAQQLEKKQTTITTLSKQVKQFEEAAEQERELKAPQLDYDINTVCKFVDLVNNRIFESYQEKPVHIFNPEDSKQMLEVPFDAENGARNYLRDQYFNYSFFLFPFLQECGQWTLIGFQSGTAKLYLIDHQIRSFK